LTQLVFTDPTLRTEADVALEPIPDAAANPFASASFLPVGTFVRVRKEQFALVAAAHVTLAAGESRVSYDVLWLDARGESRVERVAEADVSSGARRRSFWVERDIAA